MEWKIIFPQDSKGRQFFALHLNLLLLYRHFHFQRVGSVKAIQVKKKKHNWLQCLSPLKFLMWQQAVLPHHILYAAGAFQKAFLSDAENRLLLQIWMLGTESTAQMTDRGKWVVGYRKKQEINSQKCYLCFSASVWPPPPTLALCPLPASYFTSSLPCYPVVKEGKFTMIIFPLLVHYVSVLKAVSGLPWPRFGCHLKTQQFFLSAFSASPSINSHPI